MKIEMLDLNSQTVVNQCAAILVQAFETHHPLAWRTIDSAKEELTCFSGEDRIALVAKNTESQVLGWIGAISQYAGHAWELHPLAVHPLRQLQGVGSSLVQALLKFLSNTQASTLYLLTDDENHQTSLSDLNLYPNPLGQLMQMTNINHHPFEFYLKLGFCLTGVIPDANGPGKPDILMSRPIIKPLATHGSSAAS